MATETLEVLIKVVNQATQGIQQVQKQLNTANKQQQRIAKSTKSLAASNNMLVAGFGRLRTSIIAYVGVLATTKLLEFADATQRIENRIKLALTPSQKIDDLFQRVGDSAKRSRQPLEATATAFFRIQQASKTLGITQEQSLKSTELFNKLLTVQGVSMHESRSALLQFSQALQSGRFQGDEFRAISEILPSIIDLIAEATGRSVTELRELARQGKITPRVMLNALGNNAQMIEKLFLKTNVTISQGFNILSTEIFKTFRDLMKNQSSVQLIAKIFTGLEVAFKGFLKALQGAIVVLNFLFDNLAITVGLLLARFGLLIKLKVAAFFATITASVTTAIAAFRTLALVIKANPIFAIASILITLGIAFKDFIKSLISTKEATDKSKKSIEDFNVSLSLTQTLLEAVRQQFGQWTQNLEQGATQLGETIGTQITEGIDAISAAFARSLVSAENFKDAVTGILKQIGITILETLIQIGVRTVIGKIIDVVDERRKKEEELVTVLELQTKMLERQQKIAEGLSEDGGSGRSRGSRTPGRGGSIERRAGDPIFGSSLPSGLNLAGIGGGSNGQLGTAALAAAGAGPFAAILGPKLESVGKDIVGGLLPDLKKVPLKLTGLTDLNKAIGGKQIATLTSGFNGLSSAIKNIPGGSSIIKGVKAGANKVRRAIGFADGGRPPVGMPSIVGEEGPELFVPDSAGEIIPNNKLGGTIVIQRLEILPNAQIDEALTAKPLSFWTALTQEKILPALNTLGQQGNTTTLQFRENR
tara:strand:- start:134 stop:2419 length:2286 start_codon:yes stop_codon:yes gene_type:complete